MTRLNDPPRLTQSVAAPASLRRAIRLAARLEPTPQDLQQVASSLLTLRPATASREPARIGTEQSGLLRSTRRKTFVAARVAAAILAACFSVTWAGMRFWSTSDVLRAWIAPVETVARTAPADPPPVDLASRPVGVELLAPASVLAPDRLARAAPRHGKARVAGHDMEPAPLAAPEPSTAAVEAPPPPALPSEAQLLLRARNALRFDSAQALRWVREHEQRFPDGALCQEREILAIAALRGIGRSTEAQARLARFRERYPLSIHDRRINNRVIDRAQQDGQGRELSPD